MLLKELFAVSPHTDRREVAETGQAVVFQSVNRWNADAQFNFSLDALQLNSAERGVIPSPNPFPLSTCTVRRQRT